MADRVNPYKEGAQAFSDGESERANPYKYGSVNWTRWLGGWRNARELARQKQQHERETLERAWVQ